MRKTETIEKLNKMYSEEIKGYKKFAEQRRKQRRWTQEKVLSFYEALCEYVASADIMTFAGGMLACDADSDVWYRMEHGELDYLLEEFCHLHGVDPDDCPVDDNNMPYCMVEGKKVLLIPYSYIIKKYRLILQDQAEARLYGKGNPVGAIFSLKAVHGWQDIPEEKTTNNTLILNNVATLEEAEAAFERLKG